MSSANKIHLECLSTFGKSFVHNINNKGPKTLPCGTPQVTFWNPELLPLYDTD